MGAAPAARGSVRAAPPVSDAGPERDSWIDRAERYLLRLLVVTAYVGVLALVYLIVSPVLPETARFWDHRAPATAPAPPQPVRPANAPTRIPAWAWELHAWHLTPAAERGERPDAPARLPAWYWEWRTWRLELAPD